MQTYNDRQNAGMVSLVGVGLVVLAGLLSAWWWTHAVWGDISLSFLDNLAPYVGYSNVNMPEDGYRAGATDQTRVPPQAIAEQPRDSANSAAPSPYCPPGQTAQFVLGFAKLHEQLGDVMGEPIECEHPNPVNGDTLQQTTTGLSVYRPSTGELSFTDGWRHWMLIPSGIVNWAGSGPPPVGAVAPTPTHSPSVDTGPSARVVNTDGLGVILRSAPNMDARTPRGLLEGELVTILETSGSDWVLVRADASQQEGWVPSRYLSAGVPTRQ